jgi:neutral ceramidase
MNWKFAAVIAVAGFAIGRPGSASGDSKSEPAVAMKAGVAKAVITPDNWKELTTVMGTKATHKDHDIYARVLSLSDGTRRLVFVTYDLNCLDVATPILRKRCRDELKLPPENLILLGTHNHAAPIQIVPGNFAYGRWLAKRIFELISEAIQKEQGPVQVSVGNGFGYFVRAVGNAPADSEIEVLKVTKEGRTLALLFDQPCHPLQSSTTRIDTGHPGYAVDDVEAAIPGAQAMYADACGGNQFPDRGARIMSGTPKQVKELGQELCDHVLAIAAGKLTDVTGPITSKLEVLSLPLAAPLSYDEAKKLAQREDVPLNIGLVPYPHPDRKSNWIRRLLQHYEEHIPFPKRTADRVCTDDGFLIQKIDDNREYPCRYEEVIVSKIGPLCLVAMQGEVCAPIGMRIKDALRSKAPLFVCAYMGEHNLYIPTRELVRLDAYQAQVIRIQYASPVGWAPEVEDEMVNGVLRVVTDVTGIKQAPLIRR